MMWLIRVMLAFLVADGATLILRGHNGGWIFVGFALALWPFYETINRL